MESNGWNFDLSKDDETQYDDECRPLAKWYGWSHGDSDEAKAGTLSATLTGFGEPTIDFGNCGIWNGGHVFVYLDDKLIATAGMGTKSMVESFSYTPGSVLKIRDEVNPSIIGLNSVTFKCSDGKFYYIQDYIISIIRDQAIELAQTRYA